MSKYFQRQAKLTLQLVLKQEAAKNPRGAAPKMTLHIQPARTAAVSLQAFFENIDWYEKANSKIRLDMIHCIGINLNCGGRTSVFELLHYPKSQSTYAIDLHDTEFVCKIVSMLK